MKKEDKSGDATQMTQDNGDYDIFERGDWMRPQNKGEACPTRKTIYVILVAIFQGKVPLSKAL